MKTGNGHTPNPRKLFGGSYRPETSNVVKQKAPVKFSAKRDSRGGKKQGS